MSSPAKTAMVDSLKIPFPKRLSVFGLVTKHLLMGETRIHHG
jgi:hypothetical protein